MRYCPVCQERFDEEIIKFCTKDGTPLVEESTPNFVILPSENAEAAGRDLGEETVIRRKQAEGSGISGSSGPERIVVPTEQQVRSSRQVFYPPPEQPNTVKVIALTIIGTLVVLSFGAMLFWLFQPQAANINVNTSPINLNADLNTNLGFNSNFNFNTNYNANANYYGSNYNFNFNFNAPLRSPTNTPTPKQSPSPSPSPLVSASSPTPRQVTNTNTSQPPRMAPRPPTMTNRPPGNSN